MLFGLIKTDRERAAEHDAALLRRHYGADAEKFCETALTGMERPAAGRAVKDILHALKHMPANPTPRRRAVAMPMHRLVQG